MMGCTFSESITFLFDKTHLTYTLNLYNIQIRTCCDIANETTNHQSSNEVDVLIEFFVVTYFSPASEMRNHKLIGLDLYND